MSAFAKIGLLGPALLLAACQPAGAPEDTAPAALAVATPDLAALAARALAPPTPEQLAEEAAYRRQQAPRVVPELHDPEAGKRLLAVERLSAYPGPEAETALLQVLRQEQNNLVRQAAARILGDMAATLTPALLQGLAAAARPPASPELQQTALLALEHLLIRYPTQEQRRMLVQSLRRIARSPRLAPRQRLYLQDLLERFGR